MGGVCVVELVAKSALTDALPLKIGPNVVSEMKVEAITSVAPFKGQEMVVSDALKAQIGAAFPKPNRLTGPSKARVVFSGKGQAFVLGPKPGSIAGAALTDQSDAWVFVILEGPGARDVLARSTPIDLRENNFKTGHAARTLIGHMHGLVMRTAQNAYGLMVFRSMAGTLLHDLTDAMETIAARA